MVQRYYYNGKTKQRKYISLSHGQDQGRRFQNFSKLIYSPEKRPFLLLQLPEVKKGLCAKEAQEFLLRSKGISVSLLNSFLTKQIPQPEPNDVIPFLSDSGLWGKILFRLKLRIDRSKQQTSKISKQCIMQNYEKVSFRTRINTALRSSQLLLNVEHFCCLLNSNSNL